MERICGKEGRYMQAILKAPTPRIPRKCPSDQQVTDLETLIAAMGKRLQAEYIEGAIPYLRAYEPELWATLESLDREETLDALLRYEQLFFEGLQRYVTFLSGERKAA
jgi:hypothetical protein